MSHLVRSNSASIRASTVPEALAKLTKELQEQGHSGVVETIVIYDCHGKINCRGKYLDARLIHAKFNPNCSGVCGTHTTCRVSYPRGRIFKPVYRRGFFVRASALGITANPNDPEEDFWLAVVNIKLAGDCDCSVYLYDIREESRVAV